MLVVRMCLALVICVVCVGCLRAEEESYPLRWRVYCDVGSGDAFRYPYDFQPIDQFKGDLHHPLVVASDDKEAMQAVIKEAEQDPDALRPDIHHFAYLGPELEKESLTTLQQIGDREAGRTMSWTDFDYYTKSPTRPFADPKWADANIQAVIGDSPKLCGIVVKHGPHWSGILLKGSEDSGQNDAILRSFEVLVQANCQRSGKVTRLAKNDRPGKRARLVDWREAHSFERVMGPDGELLSPQVSDKPVSWDQAWEIETQHYHITCNFSPERLLEHGQYVEALFRAYNATYQPDFMPSYKFEVHIFNTYQEFQAASAAHGDTIPTAPNEIVGGFFVPDLLSLWVYEESGQLAGESYSIEHVMAHECSHQFLHVTCNGSDHIPTWINEGLAVYFEPGKVVDGEFQIGSPTERIDRLKTLYAETGTTLVQLDQYLDHHSFIPADCYGEVYAMTMFWIFGTSDSAELDPKHNPGYKRFLEYMTALRHHEDGAKAFERIFMADMVKAHGGDRHKAIQVWQEELLDYVKTLH